MNDTVAHTSILWHTLSVEDAYRELNTAESGLSSTDASQRLNEYGRNELAEKKARGPVQIFFSQFKDVMVLILAAAAVISGIVGDVTDMIVIMIIIILNTFLGFYQEYKADKAMQALKKMTVAAARTVREGHVKHVPSDELVPGDIVLLEAGNTVPADIRLIETASVKVDEAALTGESVASDKSTEAIKEQDIAQGDKKNMAFKGTDVVNGRAKGIVVATGMNTELGKIASMLQEDGSTTPLQKRMSVFAKKLSILVLVLCVLFFVSGWLRDEDLTKMLLTSISLAVAAIPEALPAVITISLALAAARMVKHKTLIRKLPAVETLGSVTYICTDKTGTLTYNKMEVEEVFVASRMIPKEAFNTLNDNGESKLLLLAFALNNDTVIEDKNDIKGDSTEIALMRIALDAAIDAGKFERLQELPFDSDRKLMTTFHKVDEKIISFTKGAPDVLIDKCNVPDKDTLKSKVDEMAENGERVLGFGFRYWDEVPAITDAATIEDDLTFLGFAGLIDPPREEVREAVSQCRSAGIVPVMITGDHPLTAKNIATKIGILTAESDMVVTGTELTALPENEFQEKVENIKVYARVSPHQKLQIIKALQEKQHYVAMTGDGVNDAPSLKRANIGIAMGITGTDVSKEAAHMILLDDNFSTIIRAVREGRRIYDNILKFIKYLMTTNSGELWTLLLGPLLGLPVALLPIHILWINLVSDGLPAIALSFEKAEKDIMTRPPRPVDHSVFSDGRGFHIIWVGLLMAAVALGAQAWAIEKGIHWQTVVFSVLCLSQMGHILAIRQESRSFFSDPFSNMRLIGAVIIVFLLQALITYVPFLQDIFKTEALAITDFLIVGALSSVVFVAVEIEKLIRKTGRAGRLRS